MIPSVSAVRTLCPCACVHCMSESVVGPEKEMPALLSCLSMPVQCLPVYSLCCAVSFFAARRSKPKVGVRLLARAAASVCVCVRDNLVAMQANINADSYGNRQEGRCSFCEKTKKSAQERKSERGTSREQFSKRLRGRISVLVMQGRQKCRMPAVSALGPQPGQDPSA